MTNLIQKEDVLQVANDLKIEVNDQIVQWVLENYESYQEEDPTGTWNLVVEQMLHTNLEDIKPKKFNFYVDQKVTTWMRTYFDVDAITKEESKELAKKFVEEGNTSAIPWEEVFCVRELMSLEENNGFSTEEIYNQQGMLIHKNGK